MADNYYIKGKEIFYRNFFILLHKIINKEENNINYDYDLTLDEVISGLHTSVTLFFKSVLCKKNYLLLISNDHDRSDEYIVENFNILPIVDGKKLHSLFKSNCLDLLNIENDYNIDISVLYFENMEIRNKCYHSNSSHKNEVYNKTLKSFLAINQIFMNYSFKRQIYRDIIRSLPYVIFKEKNSKNLKSNEDLFQSYDDNTNDIYIMYDYARYSYFQIIINIFREIDEPCIKRKLFDIKKYDKRIYQYYCPNCTVYNLNYLSSSEFSHNYTLLEAETVKNKNMKSLISTDPENSLFKCICCNDTYILKEKVSICNHQDQQYGVNSIIKSAESHYMIDNVCLECGRENFGEIKFQKDNIYIVSNNIDKTNNFKLNYPLFCDDRIVYVKDKRNFKYLRRRNNNLIYKENP